MHPLEDFAENFAHVLHLADVLQTAAAYGLLEGPVDLTGETLPALVTRTWLPLAKALTRSTGAWVWPTPTRSCWPRR